MSLLPSRRMTSIEDHVWGARTRAIHAGARPDPTTGARAVPIYQTTSFVFEDVEDAADLFALQKYGNIYSRLGNPTVAAFEERVASLEGGIGAVATGSGQAAETLLFTSLCSAGDHIVASSALYGGTYTLLDVTLRRLGIETTFVPADDPAAFAAAIEPGRTKLLYTEIIANPAGTIADLEALGEVAHDAGIPLVVDATLATPHLCRPLEHGADIVLHSATKFLGGHGTSIGGVVVDSGEFPWDNGNFPVMTEPVATYGNLRFWDNFGEYGFATKLRVEGLRNLGGVLSPFNAFLLLQGMETLPLRMDAHVANAQIVAEFLEADERVSWVRYGGLPDDPNHALAQKYLPRGPGRGVLVRPRRGPRGRRALHRRGRAVLAPRQRRGHEDAGHPPRLDDAPAALGVGARVRRRAARARAHQRRHRGPRGHPLRPRPGARMSRSEVETARGTWTPPGALAAPRDPARREDDRRRRGLVEAEPREPLRAQLPALLEHRLRGLAGEPARGRDPRARDLRLARRPARRARHRRRLPQARRPPGAWRRRRSRPAPARSGSSSACTRDEAVRIAHEAELDVVTNRCVKIEHARFHGGLHLAGFDTGVISSRRTRELTELVLESGARLAPVEVAYETYGDPRRARASSSATR